MKHKISKTKLIKRKRKNPYQLKKSKRNLDPISKRNLTRLLNKKINIFKIIDIIPNSQGIDDYYVEKFNGILKKGPEKNSFILQFNLLNQAHNKIPINASLLFDQSEDLAYHNLYGETNDSPTHEFEFYEYDIFGGIKYGENEILLDSSTILNVREIKL